MKNIIIAFGLAASLLCSGCSGIKPSGDDDSAAAPTESELSETAKEYKTTLDNFTLSQKDNSSYESEVLEYDLGGMEYTAESGKTMPFQLRGVIGVPKGEGSFPLILITHGSHSNIDESLRFDTGFTYLVEALAKNGYIAVSMDMGSAYIWKYGDNDDKEKSIHIAQKQMESLKAANDGTQAGFPIDLTGQIDFSNVGLIGHSRGGDTIFDIALDQQSLGVGVDALLAVAPVMPVDIETKEWPDVPVSILVPEYDGDVVALDGFAIDTLLGEKNDTIHAVTLLRRANHNNFNMNLKENDAKLSRTAEELKDQISAESQQEFLAQYAVDFFRASILGDNKDTLYEAGTQAPNQMYGLDVMNRVSSGRDMQLFAADEMKNLSADKCKLSNTVDSWFFEKDEVQIDTMTFGNEAHQSKKLVNIQWENQGGHVSLTPMTIDFSGYQALSVTMAADAASDLNNASKSQCFTVVLKDTKGNTSSVTLPENQNSLSNTPGFLDSTPLEDKELQFWSHPTPITDVTIPLSEFKDVDKKCIDSVNIYFDKTDSGSVYIENIVLE